MAKNGHITIHDRAGFVSKIDAIKQAAAELREIGKSLPPIAAKAAEEAGSFTVDGKAAPIYADTTGGLQKWAKALADAVEIVATGGENAAQTALDKFTAIINLHDKAAVEVQNT